MGNGESRYRNNNYSLDVSEELLDNLEKELNIKKKKKQEKHFNKVMKKKMKGKIKKTDFFQKFNKNEKGIKNISNLLNLIYDENIDRNIKRGNCRTIYEGVFGSKNLPENNLENKKNISEYIDELEIESKNNQIHNSFNNNSVINNNNDNVENNNLNEYINSEQYQIYENNPEDNNVIIGYNNFNENNNNLYNSIMYNNVENDYNNINANNNEIINDFNQNDRSSKVVKVRKIPNNELQNNFQFDDAIYQSIPLEQNNINYDINNNHYIEYNSNNEYNLNNNINNINQNNNHEYFNNNKNINNYESKNNIEQPYKPQENRIIQYEIPKNRIDNIDLINQRNSTNQLKNIYPNVKSNNYYLKKNINNQINNDSIAVVTKIPNQNIENEKYEKKKNKNELNNLNIIQYNNDLNEQQKLKYNLMNNNEKKEKKRIINSKVSNINKYIYKTKEQKINNDINKEPEDKVKNKIKIKPKKEFQIRRESDISYDIKPNYNTNISFSKNNKIKREISLDLNKTSIDKKSSSKETPKKQVIYEMSNVNDFTIKKSPLKNEKIDKENKIFKKNNIITNININNFSGKKEMANKSKTNKNIKNNKLNEIKKKKKRDKDKSKPKFNFQIDLKDLINENVKEKCKISPDKRYADIEMKRRTKNKKPGEDNYYKPFKFNINDDY